MLEKYSIFVVQIPTNMEKSDRIVSDYPTFLKEEAQNQEVGIGTRFYHQNGWWVVKSKGIPDHWGCVSEKTNAFVTFSTQEILDSENPVDDNQGKDIKLFYTVETKRIEIPVGSDTHKSSDDKKKTFEKIFRRIAKVSKFIKVPEPTLTLIEKKKYFACCHPSERGLSYDRKTVSKKEKPEETDRVVIVYTDINEATDRCNFLNKDSIEKQKKSKLGMEVWNDDEDNKLFEPWRVVSKEVEVYDLKMATVLKPEDEWLILGTIDHKDGLLKNAPGQQVPISLVPDQMIGHSYCDHCKRTIYRNKTVFVQKIKTGEILRVGGSCIRNYLGYDYEKVLSYLTDISFLDESYGDFDGGGDDWDEGFSGGWGPKFDVEISTNEVIKYFYWFYKKNGYMSKATAEKINQKRDQDYLADPDHPKEEYYNKKEVKSTSGRVQDDVDYAHNPPDRRNYHGKSSSEYQEDFNRWSDFVTIYNERLETTSDEELQWVIDFIHANRDNNFIFNASNMIKAGAVQKHLLYYITGACSWYFGKLSQEDRKRREAEEALSGGKKESEYVGTVGEKSRLENLEVVHISGYQTEWNWSNVYKLKDQIGNIYTKFGTIGSQFIVKPTEQGRQKDEQGNLIINDILVGDVVSATAEIKRHEEYQGKKQTTLGRFSKLK